jgi:hypothetical protein
MEVVTETGGTRLHELAALGKPASCVELQVLLQNHRGDIDRTFVVQLLCFIILSTVIMDG